MKRMKILTTLCVLALGLAFTPSADAQPRAAAPSFGQAFRAGAGSQLGRQVVGGGFFGSRVHPFAVRAPFFRQQAFGGFYGGAFRQQQFFGHGFRQQLFFRQSYYAPAAVIVPQPVLVPQPVYFDQSQAFLQQQAVSACGTLGLGASYGYSALGLASGCGHVGQVRALRFYR